MKKRTIFLVCGLVLLIAALAVGGAYWWDHRQPELPLSEIKPTVPTAATTTDPQPAGTDVTVPEPYVSPIDFAALKAINEDIYAWLEIEGTKISYPIVQSADDDSFYLDHNSDKKPSSNGAIFTEYRYNTTDFSDPVTLIYGHNMKSGAMFGRLRKTYLDAAFWEEHPYITVYTEQATLQYGVFAAVAYNTNHLLYSYDFSDAADFERFFSIVHSIRGLNARFNAAYDPQPGDRVIILSTCYGNSQRFLVMATLLP